MSSEALAWYVFLGAAALTMGTGLAFGAEEKAKAAAEWEALCDDPAAERSRPAADPRLVWVYRIFGGFFAGAGLALLAGVFMRPRGLAGLIPPVSLGRTWSIVLGLSLMALGSLLGVFKILRSQAGLLPRLARELDLPPRSLREKVSLASGWLLITCLVAHGLALVRLALAR